ncbi:MAG TPA: ABC transporter substrate-binding protein, partial [Spirochaetia bacterium]|nr:ABC transporter substrate-binding protein [Spirochaetia bacterium]
NGGISADGKTYTFHIRPGVKFQNGDPLTAEDVAYTFKRDMVIDPEGGPNWIWYTVFFGTGGSRDGKGNITANFSDIDKAITVSGNDVMFHLQDPYAPFLSVLAGTWGSIVDKKFVMANGGWDGTEATWKKYNNPDNGKETLANIANGSGPYKLTRWTKGNEIVLDYWDGYWGPKPAMTEGLYKVVKEWSTRKLMLLQGDADAVLVDAPYYKEMETQPNLKVTTNNTINITNIFFNYNTNTKDNPYAGSGQLDGNGVPANFFADKDIRLAFAYAWDEKTFLQEGASGYGINPVTPVPEGLPFKDNSLKSLPFDLQKATEYFKKAMNGQVWAKGFKLQIAYNTGNQVRETAAKMLAENVGKINPKFQIQTLGIEWAQYLNLYRQKQLPIFIIGWAPDYPDPDDYVVPFIASWGAYSGQQGYKNEEADKLIKEAAISTDNAQRQADYYRVQQIYMQDIPSLSIYQAVQKRFYKDWVKGNFYNPMQGDVMDVLRWVTKG